MFDHSKSLPFIVALAAGLTVTGCAAEAEPTSARTDDEAAVPSRLALSSDGLTLDVSVADHVAGSFERDHVSLRFDITRDRVVDSRTVSIEEPDGTPLFASTIRDGIDHTILFGGRAEMTGRLGEEPSRSGDPKAIDDLGERREGTLMLELKDALEAAGIDPELYRVVPEPTEAGGIAPNVYTSYGGAPGGTSYPDGMWYYVPPQGSLSFFSWGFWATTAIYASGTHQLSFQAGFAAPEHVSSSTTQYYYRQWWGAWVVVKNERYPAVCWTGSWYCPSTSAWVLVK